MAYTSQKVNFDEEGKASIAANDSNSDGKILVAFVRCASSGDEWILDTAASFHICWHRDWFATYEPIKGAEFVRMGDDTPHPIVGIGSVQIKMFDGIVRTITDVRHVPGMKNESFLL